ncbi:MAG: Stp1/IreP family PP2C-type Ser/Thr phosphatase [Dehalococcoidia bacterium]|nr:Stp1/IreP family PP2C-type Ser/Thr phosphatase [Dehalococcoidia bacterium]
MKKSLKLRAADLFQAAHSGLKRKHLIFDTAALADRGMVRENNEDSSFVSENSPTIPSKVTSVGIYIVADGMGGHQAGEVASKMAVQIISTALSNHLKEPNGIQSPHLLVKQAIEEANTEIHTRAHGNPHLSSMGTTVTLGLRLDDRLYLGHVGDSRAYLIRRGGIKQLTEDHSVVAHLLQVGMITPEEAETHPDRGKILRCLGTSAQVTVDTRNLSNNAEKLVLQNDDSLVFCTDGLTGHIADSEILDYVQKGLDANSVCQDLVRVANSRGGEDNISIIVVKMKSDTSTGRHQRKGR